MLVRISRPWAGLLSLPGAAQRALLHSLLFGFALSIAELLFNFYLASLGYAADVAGLFSTVMRVAGVLLGIPGGMLIDRIGARWALILSMLIYALSWIIMLSTAWLGLLLLAQLLIGAAYTVAMAAIVTLLASAVSADLRAYVFSLNASATLVIGLVGNVVGGALPAFASTLVQSDPQSVAAYRLAMISIVVLALIAALPLLQLKLAPQEYYGGNAGAAAPRRRLSSGRLLRLSMGSLFLGAAGGWILPFQNLYLRQEFGLSDSGIGILLGWIALAMGLGALLGTPVARCLGTQRAAGLLRLAAAPAMLLMALVPVLGAAIGGLVVRGIGVCASYPLYDSLIMEATPPRQRGMSAAVLNATWALGWAVCAAISGVVQVQWGFEPVLLASFACYIASAWAILTMRITPEA